MGAAIAQRTHRHVGHRQSGHTDGVWSGQTSSAEYRHADGADGEDTQLDIAHRLARHIAGQSTGQIGGRMAGKGRMAGRS